MPIIYGHTYIAHNSVIFGPIPNIYIFGNIGWVGCIIKLSFRKSPFTGAAVALSAKGVDCRDSETPPKDPPMGGAFW